MSGNLRVRDHPQGVEPSAHFRQVAQGRYAVVPPPQPGPLSGVAVLVGVGLLPVSTRLISGPLQQILHRGVERISLVDARTNWSRSVKRLPRGFLRHGRSSRRASTRAPPAARRGPARAAGSRTISGSARAPHRSPARGTRRAAARSGRRLIPRIVAAVVLPDPAGHPSRRPTR